MNKPVYIGKIEVTPEFYIKLFEKDSEILKLIQRFENVQIEEKKDSQ